MESLYAKLYAKYIKLKTEKEIPIDELINRDQEVKFLNFVAVADEMIQYLKGENEKLNGQVDDLKRENENLNGQLDDFKSKNEKLNGQVGDLKSENEKLNGQVDDLKNEMASIRSSNAEQHTHLQKHLMEETQRVVIHRNTVNYVFQHLVELLVGMKVSVQAQSKEPCVLVHHQSSGYSFSLTWITNPQGEVELLYFVVSMGTFERVAPEWMKETLMFSPNMCRIFFDRVSRVIKS